MDPTQQNNTVVIASTEVNISQNLEAQRAKYGKLVDTSGNEFVLPDYTLKQIYSAIPKECFQRSVLPSLRYLFLYIALIPLTFLAFSKLNTPTFIPSIIVRSALWALYGFMQMIFGCGLWILAHECSHEAFSQMAERYNRSDPPLGTSGPVLLLEDHP